MKSGTSVITHVLSMIELLYMSEINGVKFDEATKVSFIIESSPSTSKEFIDNYVLNELNAYLTKLLVELRTYEYLNQLKRKADSMKPSGMTRNTKKNIYQGLWKIFLL